MDIKDNSMSSVIGISADKSEASKVINEVSQELSGLQKKANIEITSEPSDKKVRDAEKTALESKRKQTEETKRAVEITRELNSLMREASGSDEKKKASVMAWRKEVAKLEAEYTKISKSGGDTSDISKELSNAYRELNKALGNSKIGGFQKLLNTFKRVGFYRIARRVFQVIEQGLAQGIQGLIEFDNQSNKTLSSISSSFDIIKSSIALSIMPLIETVAPIISDIAMSFADVAEQISKTSNAMKGVNTYTKINKEYMKDLQAEANKLSLSFDKFETLQGKESPFEDGVIPEEEMEKLKNSELAKTLESLKSIISDIWRVIKEDIIPSLKTLWDAFSPFISAIVKIIAGIIKLISQIINVLNKAGLLEVALVAIFGVLISIKALKLVDWFITIGKLLLATKTKIVAISTVLLTLTSVLLSILGIVKSIASISMYDESTTSAEKFIDILRIVLSLVSAIAAIWGAMSGRYGLMIGGLVGGIAVNAFANGGIAEKGDLFIANEAGPELVYSGHNNTSSVMNISQFKQAMVEAIYECSDVFQQGDGSVVLNLDGAQIARSKSFKNELNRTNAGLNLR